ncbi:TlyA family RNA methyltransferase [Aidingimonas halophila]|uniref:23S rRNA (Cytidine1920-2'-O)/16S rRNA (Cytidine1409-2'-O)-methyltransferase n=1 Tax=Aidingimonas halophila TaxID=574349 RepID=A0A1H3ETD4_9GAMM|nr:TlyA family RNA methyltransferase [Aidingimonas halophila]GHC31576.1 TlyA family rRNA (cytidine-2'-O)-methyltransferase [Aidingimonas halophila]SDX81169.1 23S rRNA (cytidine1920-2'-O)/16S rRNA (cytidine1409-2'-O)-methyltransferase [Aidingimonas halophila]
MQRLDQLLVTQGLARSRSRAQRLIRQGFVSLGDTGRLLTKPSERLNDGSPLVVADAPEERYISRAGLKLDALIQHTAISVTGRTALDVGQSTGGFTDCLLQHGAAHVIGIEVGHGQLASLLSNDDRITVLEGINARAMTRSPLLQDALARHASTGLDLAVMDVSFISQTLILPELARLLTPGGELLSLVKPQFELGPGQVNERGIITGDTALLTVESRLRDYCHENGFDVLCWIDSPIQGGDGNREFLLHARRQ